MANGPTLTVATPTRVPLSGGLLAVANVIDSADAHAGMGVDYILNQTGLPQIAPGLCWPLVEPADPLAPKSTSGISSTSTDPFALYFGVECGLMYSDDYGDRAADGLLFNEGYGIENVFEQTILAPARAAASATAVSVIDALATLEDIATIGQLTIHARRALTTYLISAHLVIADSEFTLATGQGSQIANGGGYITAGPVAGQFWMYATGQVNIWRSPVISNSAQNPAYNRAMAIAERIYSITIDGSVTAILVDTNL